jgi:DNA-binding NarL/FixJ family response regulator
MKRKTNIIIAEDVDIYMDGLLYTLGQLDNINVIEKATNGNDLVKLVERYQPDIVLTDIMMPVMTGIEACRLITARYPLIMVIATTIFEEESLILDMIDAGATSFVMKNSGKDDLFKAIETTKKGQSFYCTATNQHIRKHYNRVRERAKQPVFTPRELEIIQLISMDYSHAKIAQKLCISKTTVDICSHRILQKMEQRTAVGMFRYSLQHGLIKLDQAKG